VGNKKMEGEKVRKHPQKLIIRLRGTSKLEES